MCSVSAIMDYGRRDIWPDITTSPSQPFVPFQPFVPPVPVGTPEQKLREFLKLYEAAEEYDRKTAQPDCEDPMKMQVLVRILERLDEIEKHLGIKE